MSICLSHIMTVDIRDLTSMMRQIKKLIAAKPISCARKSRDGDKANCKEQGRWVTSLKVNELFRLCPNR